MTALHATLNISNSMNPDAAQIPNEIRSFLETLLSDAQMTNLDDATREEMVQELYARLDSFITSSVVNKLPAEKLEEFAKMTEAKKPMPEIEQYLKDNLPNAQEVFAQAFSDFRNLYLENVVKAKTSTTQEAPTQ